MEKLKPAQTSRRVCAHIVDNILVFLISALIGIGLAYALGIPSDYEKTQEIFAEYEEEYGVKYFETIEEYEGLDLEAEAEKYQLANEAAVKDERMIYYSRKICYSAVALIAIALFFSELLLHYVTAFSLKHGASLGKKLFAISVKDTKGEEVTPIRLLVRTLFGKWALNSALPLCTICLAIFRMSNDLLVILVVLYWFANVILVIVTGRGIHDYIAGTIVLAQKEDNKLFIPEKRF